MTPPSVPIIQVLQHSSGENWTLFSCRCLASSEALRRNPAILYVGEEITDDPHVPIEFIQYFAWEGSPRELLGTLGIMVARAHFRKLSEVKETAV